MPKCTGHPTSIQPLKASLRSLMLPVDVWTELTNFNMLDAIAPLQLSRIGRRCRSRIEPASHTKPNINQGGSEI